MDQKSRIDELNQRFGIPRLAEVVAGNGGLPKVRLSTSAASGEIYLHGAQLTSWQPAGAEEVIFVSEKSNWEDGRAIRGGVPVCFPWFRAKADDAKAPAHGFVRTREWSLASIVAERDGSVTVTCATESDASTRWWWPHDFRMLHRITVGATLHMELILTNTGSAPFKFEQALHTYFNVGDVRKVRVTGLDGTAYLDNVDGNQEKLQLGDLTLQGPTDNAYLNTEAPASIVDPVLRRILRTEKTDSQTTIVWNPWSQGAASLSDLGAQAWHKMVCVEASNILGSAVSLGPGLQHSMGATLSIAARIEINRSIQRR
ncbi:MAG TPA: D-hexose-6-phosphate mutarotase [Terracidiphilus sp.]|jgi:glucose-6-phosphate 1-epimerase